jgi:cell wall-associated NlpC family hydrolase
MAGLTLNAWAQVGVSLPHYSAYQYAGQPKIGRDELQAGDLVFWAYNTSDQTTIHHVAIWMGNGQIVEARNSGTVVKVSPMNWDGYIGAVRPGG